MFLKVVQGIKRVGGLGKQIHTQMCMAALFDKRRKVENEWKKVENEWKKVENEWKKVENEWKKVENEWEDDEHEQKRAFHEEETRDQKQQQQKEQLKCEITGKAKRPGSLDCTCKGICMARKSETHLIHYEGGVGIIPKK
jgi:hypothetical protein